MDCAKRSAPSSKNTHVLKSPRAEDAFTITSGQRPVYLIGAGIVGREIAASHLDANCPIHLADASGDALARAVAWLRRQFTDVECEKSTCGTLTLPCLHVWRGSNRTQGGADSLVIESVPEQRDVKQKLLSQLQWHGPPDAILATNTSTLRLRDLAASLPEPGLLCGLHFFMPVRQRPLIEVVEGPDTPDPVLAAASEHATRIGKAALCVPDTPGFIVNRMLIPYLSESLHLACEGVAPERLEQVAREAGMPLGPLEMIDLIGTRSAFNAGRALWQAFPKRIEPSPLLPALVKHKLPGRAGGRGFYDYKRCERSLELCAKAKELIADYTRQRHDLSDGAIHDRLVFPMILEAAFILRERVATTSDAVDLAMEGGLGFAASAGFIASATTIAVDDFLRRLEPLAQQHRRFQAEAWLVELLQQHRTVAAALKQLAQDDEA